MHVTKLFPEELFEKIQYIVIEYHYSHAQNAVWFHSCISKETLGLSL